MLDDPRFDSYSSYIMDSYVHFVEGAGGRVVPLILGEPEEVTLDKLSKLNGVLFPGGDGEYYEFGNFIYDRVKEYNDEGVFYPLWGTCLGYEYISAYAAEDGWEVVDEFFIDSDSLALEFVRDPRDTKMFGWLGDQAFFFEDHELAYNSHFNGISPDSFETDRGLKEMFDVVSVSYLPDDGRPFVAAIEARDYPFYGTQYHPEMTYETWEDYPGGDYRVNHSWLSIDMNHHFGRYFNFLVRHNTNYFGNFS